MINEAEKVLVARHRRRGGANMNRDDMIQIAACPKCGAAIGAYCKKRGNGPIHQPRMKAAQDRLLWLLGQDAAARKAVA